MNEQRVLSRVTTGMRVVDVAGSEIGTVDLVQRDDPNAVRLEVPLADLPAEE